MLSFSFFFILLIPFLRLIDISLPPSKKKENPAVNPEEDDIQIFLATTGERKEASSKRKPPLDFTYALVGEPHTVNDNVSLEHEKTLFFPHA